MKVYVFVEGVCEVELLRRLLPAEWHASLVFVPVARAASIPSLARSILATRRQPVAVVLDSDSLSPDLIHDRRQNMQELIQVAAPSVPAKVVMAVPQLEAILFHDPQLLPKVLERAFTPELVARARFEPAVVLKELLAQSAGMSTLAQLLNALSPQDVETLKAAPPVRELNEYLQRVLKMSPSEKQTAPV